MCGPSRPDVFSSYALARSHPHVRLTTCPLLKNLLSFGSRLSHRRSQRGQDVRGRFLETAPASDQIHVAIMSVFLSFDITEFIMFTGNVWTSASFFLCPSVRFSRSRLENTVFLKCLLAWRRQKDPQPKSFSPVLDLPVQASHEVQHHKIHTCGLKKFTSGFTGTHFYSFGHESINPNHIVTEVNP